MTLENTESILQAIWNGEVPVTVGLKTLLEDGSTEARSAVKTVMDRRDKDVVFLGKVDAGGVRVKQLRSQKPAADSAEPIHIEGLPVIEVFG